MREVKRFYGLCFISGPIIVTPGSTLACAGMAEPANFYEVVMMQIHLYRVEYFVGRVYVNVVIV
jgi:hypothetical protein